MTDAQSEWYIVLQDPVSMVRHGFAETLIDLREKYRELIELWQEHDPVVAIRDAGEWEFYPQIEAPPLEEWAEQILDAQIMDEASAGFATAAGVAYEARPRSDHSGLGASG
jgi:hypothetical protein